jgi:methionine biosynthesis protein MetW
VQQRERKPEIEERVAPELRPIIDLVEPRSHVLDLGCGTGTLLKALQHEKQVRAQGIEMDEDAIQECVGKGLFVYHGDLDEGLADFPDQSVDYVIATNTIQVLHKPAFLMQEMARVGKKCIISLPNFAHWKVRLQLLTRGMMPKTGELPYEWYESPNIHLTTIKDFHRYCENENVKLLREIDLRHVTGGECKQVSVLPNLIADYAVFMIEGKTL